MTKRKILIATPIKLGLSSSYMAGFVPTIQRQFPGVELEHCVLEGPSVNFARNEIAHYAMEISARELVFVDDDIGFTTDYFERLISHVDLDVVAGLYCKRKPGQPFYLTNLKKEAEIDPKTGLCEVEDIATGFMKIRVDTVFKTMMNRYPEREFYNKPEDGKLMTAWEFFPMGVVGPRTAEARLAKIKALIYSMTSAQAKDGLNLWMKIDEFIHEQHEPGNLRGEDYYFCHLARECGFKIYADFGMPVVPHFGKVAYPITPDMVGLDPAKALAKAGLKSE